MDCGLRRGLGYGPGGEDLGEEGVFGFFDAGVEGVFGVGGENGDGGLGQDATGVDFGDDKMDGAACGGLARGEGVADGMAAFELGEEGGVDVDDAVCEGSKGRILQDAHESGEDDDVGAGGKEVVVDGLLGGFSGSQGVGAAVDDCGREVFVLSEGEESGGGGICQGEDDFRTQGAGMDGLQDGGEV